MNHDQNNSNTNTNNFNMQSNNDVANNQPLDNSNFNNTVNQNMGQSTNINQSTFNPQSQAVNAFGNVDTNDQNLQQTNNMYQQSVQSISSQPSAPKKNIIIPIIVIIIGGIVGLIVLFIVIFSIVFANSKELVCKSKEGNITIMYDDKTITGYTAAGLTYDLDGQKKYAEQIGVDAYMKEFTIWFENNTSGTCTIDDNDN